jgi:hypothetical protein
VFRILDLGALAIVAAMVFMPRPNVKTKPALADLDDTVRARTATLERARSTRPADVAVASELADAYLRGRRPEWALPALAPLAAAADHRVGLGMAMAHADRYEFPEAKKAVDLARAACPRDPGCKEPEQARIALVAGGFEKIVREGLSFEKDPHRVRDAILEGLHNSKLPTPAPPSP